MRIRINISLLFIILLLLPASSGITQDEQSIKDYLREVLPPQEGRKIVLDKTTGLLTITDTPSNHALIKNLIDAWDIGPQQVRIQAKFVEIKQKALEEIGVEWLARRSDLTSSGETSRRAKSGTFYIGEGPTRSSTGSVQDRPGAYSSSTSSASSVGYYEYNAVRAIPPWSGTEMGAPAEVSGLGLWVGQTTLDRSKLFSYIKALEGQDKANLLSAPEVMTLSGQRANIELANIIPYATSIEFTDTGGAFGLYETYDIEEKKTGIFLEVTPTVGRGSDMITLNIHPEVSEIVTQVAITDSSIFPDGSNFESNLGWPIVDVRSTQTSITIRSGQTIVIGGLIKDDEATTKRKVPFLGDIPLLGNLFKWKNTNRTKTNLIVFLTATLVTPEGNEIR